MRMTRCWIALFAVGSWIGSGCGGSASGPASPTDASVDESGLLDASDAAEAGLDGRSCQGSSSDTCDGLVPITCSAEGRALRGAPCPYGCQGGRCVGTCTVGKGDCNGNVATVCADNAEPGPGTACPSVCVEGACKDRCTPGTSQCAGRTVQRCTDNGQWDTAEVCPFVCEQAACIGTAVPGTIQCAEDGKTPQRASANGVFVNGDPCPGACRDGVCIDRCAKGETQCSGGALLVCGDSGSWNVAQRCSDGCDKGQCAPPRDAAPSPDAADGGPVRDATSDATNTEAGHDAGPPSGDGGRDAADGMGAARHVVPGGSVITGTTTWAEGEYEVTGSIEVQNGTLSVEGCSTIFMAPGASIVVRDTGSISLVGSENCPIRITSSKPAPSRGDWGNIEIYSSSSNATNRLSWVVVEFGGGQAAGSLWIEAGASLSMDHTRIHRSASFGMVVAGDATLLNFAQNQLVDNALGPLSVPADVLGMLGPGTYAPNDVAPIVVSSDSVTRSATLRALGTAYLFTEGLRVGTVAGQATLSLEAGVEARLSPARGIAVLQNGALSALGTAGNPVRFTGSKPVGAPGDWESIEFYGMSVAASNRLEHAIIEFGGGGGAGAVWLDGGASVAITQTVVQSSRSYGIQTAADNCTLREFKGNTLRDNASGGLLIYPDQVGMLETGVYGPNGASGVLVQPGTVWTSAVWRNLGVPIRMLGDLAVTSITGTESLLTLEAAVTLLMAPGSTLTVGLNGALKSRGAAGTEVVITSAHAPPSPGDWNAIEVYAGSSSASNYLKHTRIEYGGGGSYGQVWLEAGTKIVLENTTFAQSGGGCDVYIASGAPAPVVQATQSTYSICPP